MPYMSTPAKRKLDDRDSPLKTQPVSKMMHADNNVIAKFETQIKKGDNTHLEGHRSNNYRGLNSPNPTPDVILEPNLTSSH